MNRKLLIIILLTFSSSVFAIDKRNLALELLEVTNAEENHKLVINSYVENFKKSPEFKDINFEEMLNKTMGWEVIKDPMIDIIISNYTEHELNELLKFMKSDVGKSFTRKSPIVNQQMVLLISDNLKKTLTQIKENNIKQNKEK